MKKSFFTPLKTMTMIISEEMGCAYSIDSEGTLFYSPLFIDGSVRTGYWTEVDMMSLLGEDENIRLEVDNVHEKLIKMSKAIGEYFQQ